MEDKDSLLTGTHRQFLEEASEADYSNSRGRTIRTRIRDRVVAGVGDFAYLAKPTLFPDRDAQQVAEKISLDPLEELIAFVYRLAPEAIESIVREGVEKGVEREDSDYRVREVSIDIQKRGRVLELAHRKLDSRDPLTPAEIIELLRDEQTSPEVIADHVRSYPYRTSVEYGRRIRTV